MDVVALSGRGLVLPPPVRHALRPAQVHYRARRGEGQHLQGSITTGSGHSSIFFETSYRKTTELYSLGRQLVKEVL